MPLVGTAPVDAMIFEDVEEILPAFEGFANLGRGEGSAGELGQTDERSQFGVDNQFGPQGLPVFPATVEVGNLAIFQLAVGVAE